MGVRLFAFTCGWLSSDLEILLRGESGRIRIPVPAYLIEHPDGLALFDSGLHIETQTDAAGRLGDLARVFEVDFHAGQEIAARLTALDVDPGRIRYLVVSHLLFDHVGGNAQIPNASLVVQDAEWNAGRDDDLIRSNGYDPRDYDLGHDLLRARGEHDLFGDGSVVCLPTHGHTPGHQSLRVRLPAGDVVLAADACYFRRTLEELHLPRVVHDRDAMLESLGRLQGLRDAGVRIFFGHDPEFWAGVAQPPQEVR